MKQIASPRVANGSRPPAANGSRPAGSDGSGPPVPHGSGRAASAPVERRLHRIEERLEGLDRTLTAFDDLANTALPAVLERFEATLREQGSEADASFAARLEALDDVAQVLVRRTSALERLEASLTEREEELGRRAAAADERAARLEELDARLHERGRELSTAVGEVERITDTRLPAVLADAEETLRERAQTVTTALSAHVTAAERAARHLDERTERVGRVEEALRGRVTDLERAGAVLTERLGRLRQATDTVEYGGTELTERVECLDRVIDPLVDVATRIEAGGEAVTAGVARQHEAQERQRRELARAVEAAEAGMTAAVREGVAGFVDDATEAATTARTAGDRLLAAIDELAGVEEVLHGHRTELAQTLDRDRRALLDEVLGRLLADLPVRVRRRLAAQLADDVRRDPALDEGGADATPGTGPVTRAAASGTPTPGPARIAGDTTPAPPPQAPDEADAAEDPDASEQWVYWDETDGWVPWEGEGETPTADEDALDAQGWVYWEETEGWVYRADPEAGEDPGATDGREVREADQDAGPRPPSRVLVRPSRRAVPAALLCGTDDVAVADVAEDDDGPPLTTQELLEARREREHAVREELLARLLGVPGVGSRRAQLLADAFGDLDTLVGTEADDVVAATGLPVSVAAKVVAHLRR
jgi:hypothetical protein